MLDRAIERFGTYTGMPPAFWQPSRPFNPAVGIVSDGASKTTPAQQTLIQTQVVSAQTQKRYKAYFRWVTAADKAEFKKSHTLVLISVGPEYHEGEQLKSILNLVDKSFGRCTLLIGDVLQRHSLSILHPNFTDHDLYLLAEEQGKQWLRRNQDYIDALNIPHAVTTWTGYLSHPDFGRYLELVNQLYLQDQEYKEAAIDLINSFMKRKAHTGQSREKMFELCLNYLQEESAAACLWIAHGSRFNVYPTGDNKTMELAYQKILKPSGIKYRSLSLNIKKANPL